MVVGGSTCNLVRLGHTLQSIADAKVQLSEGDVPSAGSSGRPPPLATLPGTSKSIAKSAFEQLGGVQKRFEDRRQRLLRDWSPRQKFPGNQLGVPDDDVKAIKNSLAAFQKAEEAHAEVDYSDDAKNFDPFDLYRQEVTLRQFSNAAKSALRDAQLCSAQLFSSQQQPVAKTKVTFKSTPKPGVDADPPKPYKRPTLGEFLSDTQKKMEEEVKKDVDDMKKKAEKKKGDIMKKEAANIKRN